jgi:serine/threonine-protein kinase RsbW
MTGTRHKFTVANRLDDLGLVYEGIELFAQKAGLPEASRRNLMLVLEELFSNTVNYGYGSDIADTISIVLKRDGDEIKIEIKDRAQAFDVAREPNRPNEDLGLEEMKIGGLGLFLVHELAKSVANRRRNGTNTTEICLPVEVK